MNGSHTSSTNRATVAHLSGALRPELTFAMNSLWSFELFYVFGRVLQATVVVRENVIPGEEPKNQQHPDRSSLAGGYEHKACNICYMGSGVSDGVLGRHRVPREQVPRQ
jgi:hypothetical protein